MRRFRPEGLDSVVANVPSGKDPLLSLLRADGGQEIMWNHIFLDPAIIPHVHLGAISRQWRWYFAQLGERIYKKPLLLASLIIPAYVTTLRMPPTMPVSGHTRDQPLFDGVVAIGIIKASCPDNTYRTVAVVSAVTNERMAHMIRTAAPALMRGMGQAVQFVIPEEARQKCMDNIVKTVEPTWKSSNIEMHTSSKRHNVIVLPWLTLAPLDNCYRVQSFPVVLSDVTSYYSNVHTH